MTDKTSIGIDIHSKKNAICALIAETGEIFQTTFSEDPGQIIRWIDENDDVRGCGRSARQNNHAA